MTADLTPSGDPRVDAALARLGELDQRDVAGQAAIFDEIHQRLHDILTDLEPPAEQGSDSGDTRAGGWSGP